jgi:hypothetical protein
MFAAAAVLFFAVRWRISNSAQNQSIVARFSKLLPTLKSASVPAV